MLVFGAHPDDIEFGCGAIVALETRAGRGAHFVVCSRGETGTRGTPEQRTTEAESAAALLGAQLEFVELDGDAHLELRTGHSIKLAEIIRRIRPSAVLTTTYVENQHPDHYRLGQIVRDASRLARYGGLKELIHLEPHTIEQLFYYAVTPDGEPADVTPTLFDISDADVMSAWKSAMNAHASQLSSRNYVELQIARARVLGERAGVEYAMALYSNDPLMVESLDSAGKGARRY